MTPKKGSRSINFNILITCIGRRVSLLNAFKATAKTLRLNCSVFGTDTISISPALRLCDDFFIVRAVTSKYYVTQLLQIVKLEQIKLLIPTVDLDLKILSLNKEKFEELGCKVLVSSPKVISICQDKRKTYQFLVSNGFDTPGTFTPRELLKKPRFNGPYFMKPWDGYASRGTALIKNRQDLLFYSKKVPNPICQELITGDEITCDAYVDFDMTVRCVVPRKRLEVRSGEVSKARIVKDKKIMKTVKRLVEQLGAGPGIITVQLFKTHDNKIKITEVNPRFGGGVPLSIKAGANFPKWILQQLTGKKPEIKFDGFEDHLTMLRYDAEVWIRNSQ